MNRPKKSDRRGRAIASRTFLAVAVLVLLALPATASAQQGDSRVFELRTYTAPEGRLDDIVDRFRTGTMRIFAKYDIESIGYWIPQDSALSANTLIYLLAHPSREAARANWRAFFADPEWVELRARTEADGPIVERVVSVFVDPTDFSPLR